MERLDMGTRVHVLHHPCRPRLGAALAIALASSGVLRGEPPAWEFSVAPALLKPKARVRDGEKTLKSDSVFSGSDLDLDESVPSVGLEVAACPDAGRLSLGYWRASADGSGALDSAKAFGGRVLAAGTPVDSELEWTRVRLQYLHRFPLSGRSDPPETWLEAEAGLALDRTTFRAELAFPGGEAKTALRGIFPMPEVGLVARPIGPLALRLGIGGFHVGTYPNGDTDAFEPLEYRMGLRGEWERFRLDLGYHLYHVHFEQHRNEVEEDVVHMRLRSVTLGIAYAF